MDTQGVRAVADVARLTPGLTFTQTSSLRSNIAIRGISSTSGTATTGVYVDDTPIQTRVIGVSSTNVYPQIFDLERVEVLRGPQGTLFGAGSEGGTVRFIQSEPSLTQYSSYSRAEYSNTTGSSDPSYEIGAAFGGPIVPEKLGFRLAAWYRKDGGWIDRETGTAQVLDSTGKSGIDSINFQATGQGMPAANWGETTVVRGALTFAPVDLFTVTGSVLYQKQYNNDQNYSIWPGASSFSSSQFVTPLWVASDSPTDTAHTFIPKAGLDGYPGIVPNQPYNDQFYLPALKLNFDLGPVQLVSDTSYFDDARSLISDYTLIHEVSYAHRPVPNAGDQGWSWNSNTQRQLTQEIRVQSTDPAARLNWVAGLFYDRARQANQQVSYNNFVNTAPSISVAPVAGFPTPAPAVTNGPPYGPGASAYQNYYGIGLIDGVYNYYAYLVSQDRQFAGFAQLDFRVTDKLKLIAGIREAHDSFSLTPTYRGPLTNLNITQGRNCLPGTGAPGGPACVVPPPNPAAGSNGYWPVGTGPFAPAFVTGVQSASENANTPKLGVSYQADSNNLYYATASKGFRPGGAQQQQPSNCDAQLVAYGYVNANGSPAPPSTFKSDSLWNYEIGGKNKLLDGRLTLNSSAYLIKWSNIQTSVSLTSCLQSFFANLGQATGRGFDLQAAFEPVDNLVLSPTVSYNKITFDNATILGGKTVYTKGSVIPGSGAPWTVIMSGEYGHKLFDQAQGYGHLDWTYTSAQKVNGTTDPGTASYDPMLRPPPATTLVNGRVGVRLEGLDVSLFMNNVANAHPDLALTRTFGQPVYTDYTFRPRTVGVTMTYRY
jgi:outer membrane receptor protein involved in Fe transport